MVVAVRRGFVGGVVVALLLIAYGLVRFRAALEPSVGIAILAAVAILLGYAATGWFAAAPMQRAYPGAFRMGCIVGGVLAAVFILQIFLEYLLPVNGRIDQVLGWIVFGSLPLLFLILGAIARARYGRVRAGVVAAVWSMLIGSLTWIIALLAAYFLFVGTPQEQRLFAAEEVWGDFRRSGEHDLRGFIMTDYLGACFFHLSLGPAVAVLCAGIGGMLTGLLIRLSRLLRGGLPRV